MANLEICFTATGKTVNGCALIFRAAGRELPYAEDHQDRDYRCLSIAAVPAALFAYLWLWIWYKTAQVESFYQEHRLLGQMHTVEKQSTSESASAREAVLQLMPLGTDRETAVAALHKDGLGCQTIAEPIADTRLRRRFLAAGGLTNIPNDGRRKGEWVDCQAMTPNVMGYGHWIVDLEFDTDGHLNDAGVAIWNIFL